ncbi:hypothetical protein F2Q68_00030135 [Brassica cretica]|uniref:Uncharacterized protein n=1 Tax=Brassica cretica TaxID=69181 RepID=A0A8S9G5P5_BRACR|nr:hypothetical protein F2Q68_00030135 [Brassica cretica]
MITHLKFSSPIISYPAIIFSYQSSSFITYSILISRSLKLVVCRNGFKLTTITMTSLPPLWGCAPEVKVDIAEMHQRCYEPETEVLRTRDGGGGRCGSEQERSSGGIIRNLEVQICNALVPVDFHVVDIKLNWNSSLLLGRAFLATLRAVCDMSTNILCLTLTDPDVHYDPVRP